MDSFLINTVLGLMVVRAENPAKAWLKYVTEEQYLGDTFLTREELIDQGYRTIEKSPIDNVYYLKK